MTTAHRQPGTRKPRLLLISPTDYQSAVRKGVESLLKDFDEGGFFEQVVIAFPFARTSCRAAISERVMAWDLGADWLPFGARSRFVRRIAAPLHIVRAVIAMVRSVRDNDLDIVRATDPCFAGSLALLTARLSRRPLCVSIHADFDKRHELSGATAGASILGSRRAAKTVEGFVLRRANMILPIRDSLRPYAIRAGAPVGRIRVIPHGADLRPFVEPTRVDPFAIFDVPPDHRMLSFVGRLIRENYLDDILALAKALAGSQIRFTVLIAGGGPDEERLRTRVEHDSDLKRVVKMVGFQPREIVAAIRQRSLISLCLMGGFSLIEACAAGSAVVAYDVEWHGELIHDQQTGFLVPEHDLARLTASVGQLLDDPQLARRLGGGARDLALSRHDLAASSAIKQQCYLELLQTAQGQA